VVAVALVAGGILGLQALVPAEKDSPAVVRSPDRPVSRTSRPPSRTPATPSSSAPSASASASASPTATVLAKPAITVLNNSRVNGLAKKAAGDFAARGWTVSGTGNLTGRLPRTTVYYGDGQRPAAEALRAQFPAIAEMAPRYAGLPGDGGLTVVVTRDYPH
jgi:hypothetical protein